jgi:hypothetical protein
MYPWAMAEDLSSLIAAFASPPWDEEAILNRLATDHGIRVARPLLRDVLAMMSG